MPKLRRSLALAVLLLATAAAAPLTSSFSSTDCTADAAQCTGPKGNVLSVERGADTQALLVDGRRVLSVQGTVGPQAEWHLLGDQLTGVTIAVETGSFRIYAIVRLAEAGAGATCLVATSSQRDVARGLADHAGDMRCLPPQLTEITPQRQ